MSPPAGCYCIPGGPGVGCYRHIHIPAKCGDWDNHGYNWCCVSGCCGEKKPAARNCGGWWAKCGMLVPKIGSFLKLFCHNFKLCGVI